MSTASPYESRSECIARHITRLTRETGASIEDYSLDVLRVWQERTPAAVRDAHCADFKERGSVFELMKANGKKIRRWLNPEESARPCVDVEEALVLALREPYRSECLRDLAARCGGLFVPIANGTPLSVGEAADLLRETGEALQAVAPLLTDGRIDRRDAPELLRKARAELLDVQASAAAMLARIDGALESQAQPRLRSVR